MFLLLLITYVLLVVLCGKLGAFVYYSHRHHQEMHRFIKDTSTQHYEPLVSVIVPCYNERMVVENCVHSLQAQDYRNIEIILVDDGSTDDTADIIARLANGSSVQALFKSNGGKSTALNHGIASANGEIIVCMDADSMFVSNTVTELVRSFKNPEVAAVGGNVRVANRNTFLTRHQTAEYIQGLTIQRRTFSEINCMQVISGAIGAFRRSALRTIGGYSSDTIVEDMDITVTLARHGLKVIYNPLAIAYTEAPENIRDFAKQRYRWSFGNFQVLKKHRAVLGNSRFGMMGLIGLPYYAIFPWVDAFVSLLLITAVYRMAVDGFSWSFVFFYALLSTVQAGVMLYALKLDNEDKRLVLMSFLENLFYSHAINIVTVIAAYNYQFGRQANWNKLTRLGKNTTDELPSSDASATSINRGR